MKLKGRQSKNVQDMRGGQTYASKTKAILTQALYGPQGATGSAKSIAAASAAFTKSKPRKGK